MCGIVGYVGSKQAAPILVEGLRNLEYRGYDSAGIAVAFNGGIQRLRAKGKLAELEKLLKQAAPKGCVALGHTRWATHGRPSEENAHPHADCTKKLVLIHNGIIENYLDLKEGLAASGHAFESETDTEVVAHLIEEKLKVGPESKEERFFEAVRRALNELKGAYALAVLWAEAPGMIIAAKTASPLVVGLGEGENFLGSDVPAFLSHARKAVFLEDGEMAVIRASGASFFSLEGRKLSKSPTEITWDRAMAQKAGYKHFMLKEIHDQPQSCEDTLRGRLFPLGKALEKETGLSPSLLKVFRGVHLVACGTAHHAGMIGRYWLEELARLPAQAETASEFRYRETLVGKGDLVIAVSQSGETADTLAAVRLAKEKGAKVLAISNCVGSAITRAADFNLYTHCGPELGVASTKAFIGQLTALAVVALHAAAARRALAEEAARALVDDLMRLPAMIRTALKLEPQILEIAKAFHKSPGFFFIGRNVNYPVALEGALKLKEISYIHAEGYAAGELKHGPIAMIDADIPVIAIATRSKVFDKILSNIAEVRARGGQPIVLATEGDKLADFPRQNVLRLPPCPEILSPILNIVPLQLLAYHIADLRGCNVDQPRNLAKSVTVE